MKSKLDPNIVEYHDTLDVKRTDKNVQETRYVFDNTSIIVLPSEQLNKLLESTTCYL